MTASPPMFWGLVLAVLCPGTVCTRAGVGSPWSRAGPQEAGDSHGSPEKRWVNCAKPAPSSLPFLPLQLQADGKPHTKALVHSASPANAQTLLGS